MGATKRCGLFGGTFDPIHSGHVALIHTLAQELALDEVVLMPTAQPPHKLKNGMANAAHRLAMCRLAVADCPFVTVSDWEIQKGGASFTVETLQYLCETYPDTQWYLFVGADMFLSIDTWFRFADIARYAVLCAVPRDGVTRDQLCEKAAALEAQGARTVVADMVAVDVSSTLLRECVMQNKSLGGLVPPQVEAYIMEHALYQDMSGAPATDEQIVEILRGRLKPKRFEHSLAVAEEAERLAARYGADVAKARTAALLHDIMKNTPPETQLQLLDRYGVAMNEVERGAEKLYHAMSGAAFAEQVLGVTDRDVLNAVRYHTTARAGMSMLEKVLYLADFTSADRDYDDVDEMRRRVDISVESAMSYALIYTIKDLVKKKLPIHPDTVAAFNELMLLEGEKTNGEHS